MTPFFASVLVALGIGIVVLRMIDHARARRAERERRAAEERSKAAARALDDKVSHAEDGGPRYRDGV